VLERCLAPYHSIKGLNDFSRASNALWHKRSTISFSSQWRKMDWMFFWLTWVQMCHRGFATVSRVQTRHLRCGYVAWLSRCDYFLNDWTAQLLVPKMVFHLSIQGCFNGNLLHAILLKSFRSCGVLMPFGCFPLAKSFKVLSCSFCIWPSLKPFP